MPASSKKQQCLMGAALAVKRGGKGSPAARRLAARMSEGQLSEYAGSRRERLPKRKPRQKGVNH